MPYTICLYSNNVNMSCNLFEANLTDFCHNLSYFGGDICHDFLTFQVYPARVFINRHTSAAEVSISPPATGRGA
jgi:hypothetical protein